ncbi:MAG: rane protein [Xanthomonadaceae bacterium]|nr:rane protein [Xanthomonadaceae bacterium]
MRADPVQERVDPLPRAPATASVQPPRFVSVDVLRGLTVAAMLLVNTPGDWNHVYAPLLHSEWNGCTPTDLIFPMFLFVAGVSISLGVVSRVERGANVRATRQAVLLRAARIVGLGLLLNLCAWWLLDKAYFRPWGVLQRIGLCVACAAVLAIHTRGRTQWMVIFGLLFGYWGLLAWGGSYAPFVNLASRIDTALLGPLVYEFDATTGRGHDPEGLLSTIPAIATTLLGLRAGDWLRRRQVKRLLPAGIAALVAGALWGQVLPINKNLWTSSYVLWTGGWSMLALAICHTLVDRRGWPALGRTFGVNAIAAYAGSGLMYFVLAAIGWWEPIYRVGFADWMTPRFGPLVPSLTFALAFVLAWWLIARALARRGWFLRI